MKHYVDLFKTLAKVYIVFLVTIVAAWFTHIIVCIQDERWLFLIAGAIAFPIAVVHGIGSWFGAF